MLVEQQPCGVSTSLSTTIFITQQSALHTPHPQYSLFDGVSISNRKKIIILSLITPAKPPPTPSYSPPPPSASPHTPQPSPQSPQHPPAPGSRCPCSPQRPSSRRWLGSCPARRTSPTLGCPLRCQLSPEVWVSGGLGWIGSME